MMKHAASATGLFVPCYAPPVPQPSTTCAGVMHVLFSDAAQKFEEANQCLAAKDVPQAYASCESACSLFQEVVGPIHCDVAKCYDLLAMILFQAGEFEAAITFASRSLPYPTLRCPFVS